MALLRVLLNFTHSNDHTLEETTGHVLAGLYANATIYPSPPVTQVTLQSALKAFTSASAAQKQGGTAATALKDQARDALITLLRKLALYVQTTIQGNPAYGLAELLLSGFDAVSTSRAQHPLAQPVIGGIDNVGMGRLQLHVRSQANVRLWEAQSKTPTGDWVTAGLFQNSKMIIVTGLTPGVMYTFQLRAMGGSTGHSDWSDPSSHMNL